ncbi:uncharacterized protein LOC114041273 isoform X3 [Vombatus ursinus]|uniref:uncharacterized protein LOC114041273 isoform X3 n=1 Tax=Vombatus ursinus TaxID=29139 RepID=UPI000FFD9BA8|nr:uncharacterized protein LOC114041273 isoform X3 [Vombatus ursinus]
MSGNSPFQLKGEYDMTGARVALTLCALGGQIGEDRAVAALEAMYQALGFKNYLRRVAKAQSFQKELAHFRELLDAYRNPISCALVVLLAHSECRGWLLGPDGREVQEKELVGELSHCQALWGKAKVFLLLGSHDNLESNAFLPILTDHCRHFPHWHLLEVLTQVIGKVTQEMPTTTEHRCPIFHSSLRGALYFGRTRSQDLEVSPIPQGVYDMSGEKVALVLCVTQDRPGAEQDLKALKRLFQTLGFKSILKMDPTAQDFRKELAQFREHLDACRTTVSCALIALMAHGEPQGRLLGADGQMVEVEEMVRELSTCQVLRGKAKVFLLQGCRGTYLLASCPLFSLMVTLSPTGPARLSRSLQPKVNSVLNPSAIIWGTHCLYCFLTVACVRVLTPSWNHVLLKGIWFYLCAIPR